MRFEPNLTPKQVIQMGSFGGIYFNPTNNCINIDHKEFPSEWFQGLEKKYYASNKYHKEINFFKVKSGSNQLEWEKRGWVRRQDPRGWFQWYCRYFMGRRINKIDDFQIKRWRAFGPRHIGGIKKNCEVGDIWCRPKQRQALLQWAYDPFF